MEKISVNGRYFVPVLLLIVITGMAFSNFPGFTDSHLKSKWYWLYLSVSFYGLFSIVSRSLVYKVDRTVLWLVPLFLYGLIRAAEGLFVSSFLAISTLFVLIYLLFGTIIYKRFGALASSVTVVALFQALYGIGQWIGIILPGERFTVIGNFDNPAGYASVLSISAPFILYFTFSDEKRKRYGALGVYAIVTIAVILSASRSGILSLIVSGFLYVTKRRGQRPLKGRIWSKIILTSLIISVLTGLYVVKPDSANGRLLIWKCSGNMIQDKPFFGHGYRSFEAEYMLYQASYFKQHPDSKFASLADNVKHPFNELLRLTTEFGIVALLLLAFLVWHVIRIHRKKQTNESFTLISTLSIIVVFSCFSYPFSYPFTWFIVACCISGLSKSEERKEMANRAHYFWKPAIALLSIFLIGYTIRSMYYDHKWHNIIYQNKQIGGVAILSKYEQLYPHLKNDPYFLYNYATRANFADDFSLSTELTKKCEEILNDYDIEMLQGDNFQQLGNIEWAEQHYWLAANMCPGRFMPLYKLVNLYDSIGHSEQADSIARVIMLKPEKIPSGAISAIKIRMKKRFEKK